MKLFSAVGVYWGVKLFLILVLASALVVVARAQALPTVAEVAARIALTGGENARTKATVLFFIGEDCPISNALMPEANRIVEKYTPLGIAFYFVYPDRDLTDGDAAHHAKDYGMRAPVLVDRRQLLVEKAGVKVTPEVAVFGARSQVVYRGRINDLYAGLEQRREAAETHDLRNALDAILAGRLPPVATMPAVGCFISPKKP